MALVDDDFVFHSLGVGQAFHLGGIVARDNRRRLQHKPARRAARHKARLRAGGVRDSAAGGAVEVVKADHHSRSLVHRVQDFGADLAAAVRGSAARCVDNALDAQRAIDALRVAAPSRSRHSVRLQKKPKRE